MTLYSLGFFALLMMSSCIVLSVVKGSQDQSEYEKLSLYHQQLNSNEIRRLSKESIWVQLGDSQAQRVELRPQNSDRTRHGLLEKTLGIYLRETLDFQSVFLSGSLNLHQHSLADSGKEVCLRVQPLQDQFISQESRCGLDGFSLQTEQVRDFTLSELLQQKFCGPTAEECEKFCSTRGGHYKKKSRSCNKLRVSLKKAVLYVDLEEQESAEFTLSEKWLWNSRQISLEYAVPSPEQHLQQIQIEIRHKSDLQTQSLEPIQFSGLNLTLKIMYAASMVVLFGAVVLAILFKSESRKIK